MLDGWLARRDAWPRAQHAYMVLCLGDTLYPTGIGASVCLFAGGAAFLGVNVHPYRAQHTQENAGRVDYSKKSGIHSAGFREQHI